MPIEQPDVHARLEAAALELFSERGYENTTVLDIVRRAGVARRTFFRYFATKRDVLFWGVPALQDAYVEAVAGAPPDCSPLALAERALLAAAELQGGDRVAVVRRRQQVVDATVELQERQLLTRAQRSTVLAEALVRRGVEPLRAAVTADAALAAYGVAFGRWAHGEADDLRESVRDAIDAVRSIDVPARSGDPVSRPRSHAGAGRRRPTPPA